MKKKLLLGLLALSIFSCFNVFSMEDDPEMKQVIYASGLTRVRELSNRFQRDKHTLTIGDLEQMRKAALDLEPLGDLVARKARILQILISDEIGRRGQGRGSRSTRQRRSSSAAVPGWSVRGRRPGGEGQRRRVQRPMGITDTDRRVRELFRARDRVKGIRKFVSVLPNGRRVENIVVQLPTINQFNKQLYINKIEPFLADPSYANFTCPALSMRSCYLLNSFFEGKKREIRDFLVSYPGAVQYIKFFEDKNNTPITNLTGAEVIDVIDKFSNNIRLQLSDNVTVLESVGLFDKLMTMISNLDRAYRGGGWKNDNPDLAYYSEWLDIIKSRIKGAQDGFWHAFILGTLEKQYYDTPSIFDHWLCVFFVKAKGQNYWFVVDSSGYNNLHPNSIEYARIRFFIESLLDARNKINYGDIYKRYCDLYSGVNRLKIKVLLLKDEANELKKKGDSLGEAYNKERADWDNKSAAEKRNITQQHKQLEKIYEEFGKKEDEYEEAKRQEAKFKREYSGKIRNLIRIRRDANFNVKLR